MPANPWRRGPITRNPYYRTAFHVSAVSPSTVSRKDLREDLRQAQDLVRRIPGARSIGGEAVTEADVLAAGRILSDPSERLEEELLAHYPESFATPLVEHLRASLLASMRAQLRRGELRRPRHLRVLRYWFKQLLDEHLSGSFSADCDPLSGFGPIHPCGTGDERHGSTFPDPR